MSPHATGCQREPTDHRRKMAITPEYKELVAEAEAVVEAYSPEEAVELTDEDGVHFVDVREIYELAAGMVRGGIHAPMGRLETHLDPNSPHYKDKFDNAAELVFYCATGSRSALAARRAQQLGLERVAHLEGGFSAWVVTGGPTQVFDAPERT
ncbi:rhodanese-like domain-containing protein [Halobacteria archaeon AArc-curdl1]|uniref:Rhodanese-like domain-containing protein n=1 Tax=Natronosalvus hydrolyticus TaxID=2979988 RepID=A0AAP2Z4T4_9EURY|nr:rhodanese-like domain-containing protein [Halobacteria archaeon AArc-curdl1]